MVTDFAINVGCVAAETGGMSAARNRKSESVDRRVIGGEFIRSARGGAVVVGWSDALTLSLGYIGAGDWGLGAGGWRERRSVDKEDR